VIGAREETKKCYHHDVCDSALTAALLHDLEAELGEYSNKYKKEFDAIQCSTKLLTDPAQAKKTSDVHHIEYAYDQNDQAKKNEHSVFIAQECILRAIPIQGKSLDEWRGALQLCVETEAKIKFLQSGMKMVVEFLIPCIYT
jgi:DNA polymerase II large subunit